jgi:hypothetical protein
MYPFTLKVVNKFSVKFAAEMETYQLSLVGPIFSGGGEARLGGSSAAEWTSRLKNTAQAPAVRTGSTDKKTRDCLFIEVFVCNTHSTLQMILDLCIPEKKLAKTRSQISFISSKVIHGILSGTT